MPENKDRYKSGSKPFARQLGQSFATKLVIILLRVIRNAILARALGPVDRGLLSLVTNLPDLIISVGNTGIGNSAAYYIAKKRAPFSQILGNTNTLIIGISIILIFFSFFIVGQSWLTKDHSSSIQAFSYFIAIAIPLILLKAVNVGLLNVLHRITAVNIITLLDSITPLLLFLLLWLVFGLSPLPAATWAWLSSLVLVAFFSTLKLKRGFPVRLTPNIQKDLLSYGSRGHFDTLFQKLVLRIDFLFVSSFLGNEALGYYAIATAAAELLLTLPSALSVPLFSFFMRGDNKDINAITSLVLRVLIFLMVMATLFFALSGEVLIIILFGDAYLPATEPFLLLLPGIVFLSYCSLVRLDLLGRNMPGTVSIVSGGAVVINIILNTLLVSDHGLNGVAFSSTFSYFFGALGLYIFHKKATGLTARQTLIVQRNDINILLNIFKR